MNREAQFIQALEEARARIGNRPSVRAAHQVWLRAEYVAAEATRFSSCYQPNPILEAASGAAQQAYLHLKETLPS